MFKQSRVIFEFYGPLGVHVQISSSIFLLFLVFVPFNHGATAMIDGLIFLSLIIGSIFLHELGHAWGMLIQSVGVRRIMIYGGGGFCEASRSTTPREGELIVAMGPIVNLTIWAVASMSWPHMGEGRLAWAVYDLALINIFLAVLNLIPVMPLDGGRLFQMLMLRLLPTKLAIQVSGAVGLVISVLWIPAMIVCYTTFGLVLFFIPPIFVHWQMLRRGT